MTAGAGSAVTYLFSDVEGSTRLWEQAPERAGPAFAWHDALARSTVAKHHGRVVKMTGDGVHAAFDAPADALAAVIEMQLALAERNAAAEGGVELRVRCGLHLGVDEQRDNDFFGREVNRAARVMSAAHGGQVLLSEAVAEQIAGSLPAGSSLRELGVVRLRDLARPERLFQLVHPRLRADFPALRSLADTPNNLPQQVNSFIGREREVAEARALLQANRLVTLLAMGGIGKSRLSIHLGAEMLEEYPDGVWLVELAGISEAGAVAHAVAGVLGVREEAGGTVTGALLKFVRDRSLLLILDNCEHLIRSCAELAKALLQAGPRVKVLATSRDALQVIGETSYYLHTLSAPGGGVASPEELMRHEAVRLFVDRAAAAQPAFRLSERNAAAVAEICHRLDGIPLALELAAARMRSLSAEAIAARLGDRFKLLVSGDRTALPRQKTLRALIDWSHDLLSPAEQTLFRRLSVFAGGWTLAAAEAVGSGGGIDNGDVVDLLANLVQKSLVVMDADSDRYRMLDTVRQYAQENLAGSPDEADTRERHLAHFCALVEEALPQLLGPEQGAWMARLDAERDNILSAHAWCAVSPQGAELDLRMVSGLKFYWLNRGLLGLGIQVTREALERAGAQHPGPTRCGGLSDAGQICYFMGRYAESKTYLGEALELARRIDQPARLLTVLHTLVMVEAALGDASSGLAYCDEALALAGAVGDRRDYAGVINSRAQLLRLGGDLAGARAQYEEVRDVAVEIGDHESCAIALLNLAMVDIAGGDAGEAAALLVEVLQIAEAIGSLCAGQSLLDVCAALAALNENWIDSARFFGAAEAQAERSGISRDPADLAFLLPMMERTERALGSARCAEQAQGRTMAYRDALAAARAYLTRRA